MGTSGFAAYCLSQIAESRVVDIKAAYCKPEETRHRHKKDLPVHTEASRHGISVGFPPTLKTPAALDELKKISPDLILVIDYGLILPRAVLDVPRMGCLNLHASLLPLYRGAAPIQRAVMSGEKKTGVTVMFMSEEVDAGDILLQQDVEIADDDDFFSLSEKLEKEGAGLMVKTLEAFSEGTPMNRVPQTHQQATYAHKIKKEEGIICWKDTATAIHNKVRGLIRWPGASCRIRLYGKEHTVKIHATTLNVSSCGGGLAPGLVADISGGNLLISAGENSSLFIRELQVEGKKTVTAKEFVNGFHIKKGDMFY
jgi:methionyl-tRNA formyltransferase